MIVTILRWLISPPCLYRSLHLTFGGNPLLRYIRWIRSLHFAVLAPRAPRDCTIISTSVLKRKQSTLSGRVDCCRWRKRHPTRLWGSTSRSNPSCTQFCFDVDLRRVFDSQILASAFETTILCLACFSEGFHVVFITSSSGGEELQQEGIVCIWGSKHEFQLLSWR